MISPLMTAQLTVCQYSVTQLSITPSYGMPLSSNTTPNMPCQLNNNSPRSVAGSKNSCLSVCTTVVFMTAKSIPKIGKVFSLLTKMYTKHECVSIRTWSIYTHLQSPTYNSQNYHISSHLQIISCSVHSIVTFGPRHILLLSINSTGTYLYHKIVI